MSRDSREALRSPGAWALGPAAPVAAPPSSASGPDQRALARERIVDALWDLQQQRGWLDDAAVAEAASSCGLTPAEADEIATFYNLLLRKPAGRIPLFVCDSISCELRGGARLMSELAATLETTPGGVSRDGAFGLLPIVCLGHCDRAPCLLAGETIYGPVDLARESATELLERIRRGPGAAG